MKQALIALLMVTVALPVRAENVPQEVDVKIADGIAALTKQVTAVTPMDISRALDLDLNWYKRSENEEGGFDVDYWRGESKEIRARTLVLYFRLTTVQVYFATPSIPGPALPPSQWIKVLLERGRCLSVKALAERLHVKFRGYRPAIMASTDGPARPVATLASESNDQGPLSYLARIAGNPGASKTEAVENLVDLHEECSQAVNIQKTFDYDYWNSLCPFEYNDRLIDSVVVPPIKEKYGSEYTEFALRRPELKDYGSFIALRLYKSAAGPNQKNEFAMEVDRCTEKVIRTWEVPVEALRDQSPH